VNSKCALFPLRCTINVDMRATSVVLCKCRPLHVACFWP